MSLEAELSAVAMFASLPPTTLSRLAAAGRTERFAAGEVVCREGDASAGLYVIRAGTVRITKRTAEGVVEVAVLGPGEVVGELALLDSRPRSASATCLKACELLAIDRTDFMDLLVSASSRATLDSVFAALVERVRATTEQVHHKEIARQALEAERHRGIAEMVAGVAHELNTPIGVANTGASILVDRLGEPALVALAADPAFADALEDMREAATLIQRNLQRAHALVEHFKHVAVGHFVHTRETVDLEAFVAEVLSLFHPRARHAGLQITVESRLVEGARTFTGETGHLTQILMNLLANIERHAYPAGGPVLVLLSRDGDQFVLEVADRGRGIPAADQQRIFTPFYTTRRGDGGSGLGLAIVQSAVTEGLGGRIEVHSTPGEGTRMVVRFPVG